MEKLTDVKIRSKIYQIGGIELELKARPFEDIDLLAKLNSPEMDVRLDAIKRLTIRTVQEALPDDTDEKISIFIMNNLTAISDAVMELNNIKTQDKIEDGTRT